MNRRITRCRIGVSLVAAGAFAALGTVAIGDYGLPLVRVVTTGGPVLAAERNGRTLYVRPVGEGGRCVGACSFDWPPFQVRPDDFPTDGLSIVRSGDGDRQWSLGSRPLHFFAGDTARGETRGDGIGRWRALRPEDIGGVPSRARAAPSREKPPL